jgi:prolyl 4-hydroxylase
MARVEDQSMNGGGLLLKQKVWDAARSTIEQWTGQRLAECSLYGIRIYEEGAILAPHVDRLPLVASAIINVDQDVDEPWPLEVIGHDGKATNITASIYYTEQLKQCEIPKEALLSRKKEGSHQSASLLL